MCPSQGPSHLPRGLPAMCQVTQPRRSTPPPTVFPIATLFWFRRRRSVAQLYLTPWSAARQAPLSFTISRSLLRLMSIESVMPSNHLILCRPLLPLPSVFPSIRVFSSSKASILYGPALTSIHDYWKNHSFDYSEVCWQSDDSAF